MTLLTPPTGPYTERQAELGDIAGLLRPLESAADLDPLLERIGDSRFVLLGEASHGTSEYYRWRTEITRRLVTERGFSFVAVEGDWPDCFELNRWVKETDPGAEAGPDPGPTAPDVLMGYERWPTWMWANREVAELLDWLRGHNRRTAGAAGSDRIGANGGVGFYGLDVYSLWRSMDRVLGWLAEHEPDAVDAAWQAVRCFEPYREDPQRYALATRMLPSGCEDDVVDLLSQLQGLIRGDGRLPEGDFDALQNAEVVAGAERYYRAMVRADNQSWNVRDLHMADTLDRLMAHHGPGSKAVVWEHNTHIGDARATDMATAGMFNLGQLVRQRHRDDSVVLVGFGGYEGSVIAARSWGAPMEVLPVPSAVDDSHEALIHELTTEPALLVFPDDRATPWLSSRRGHRAIGVVYHPGRDRLGNWVPTVMGGRYDAFISFGVTQALHPLHLEPVGAGEKETYPWTT